MHEVAAMKLVSAGGRRDQVDIRAFTTAQPHFAMVDPGLVLWRYLRRCEEGLGAEVMAAVRQVDEMQHIRLAVAQFYPSRRELNRMRK